MNKSETGQLLTRHVNKSRRDTANRLSNLLTREYKIASGEIDATPSQVNALRNQILRVLPNVNPEDFTQITSEVKTQEEIQESVDVLITDPSTYVIASVEAMEKARDVINARLANITPIKKAG